MEYETMSIKEIREFVAELDLESRNIEFVCNSLKIDKRKSVNEIGKRLLSKICKLENEKSRLKEMYSYENNLYRKNITFIAGIDEVGRGPLSGPVVSSAVVLPANCRLMGLNDSKKLSEKKRNRLYHEIMLNAIDVSVGMASPNEIDEINILNATKLSMKRAVDALKCKADHLLIDALKLDDIEIEQTAIIKGDEKSASIAAASIIAKVTRDYIMVEMSRYFKVYGFERNKGYGTAEHIEALKKYGPVNIHRRSFIKGIVGGR
ncbi:MAG: ribonuclease HII [Peptostreptococcaceae bacterium]|nr:ribonuclease HII [Peptostreptococcaceae bacterium]